MRKDSIIFGDITVEKFEKAIVSSLEMTQNVNEHTRLKLELVFSGEEREMYVEKVCIDSNLILKLKDEKIFAGIVTEFEVSYLSDICKVQIKALSLTYKLDIEKKFRSFQDTTLSYNKIIAEVLKEYEEATFIDNATSFIINEFPLIQYNETDFEFIKRIASKFNCTLQAHLRDSKISFYIGNSDKEKKEIISHNYTMKKNFEKYSRLKNTIPGMIKDDFIYYEIESNDLYDLGSKVTFLGEEYYVCKAIIKYDKSLITNMVTLSTKKGFKIDEIFNEDIIGLSLDGKVLDIKKDMVKVHLDIDKKQDIEKAYWYPFATMYASKKETGFYFMPEKGDRVRLYHSDSNEKNATIISSPRTEKNNRMKNPDVKYLRSASGKEVRLRPGGIDIISKDGKVFMTLNDDGSVYLNSDQAISLTAENKIDIKSKIIKITATDNISIKSKDSAIDVDEMVNIKGSGVKLN